MFPGAPNWDKASTINDIPGLIVEDITFGGSIPYNHSGMGTVVLTIGGDVYAPSGGGSLVMPVELGAGNHLFDLDANVSLNGPVSGPGAVEKRGTGWLPMLAENSFTGAVDVAEGFLSAYDPLALGDPGTGTTIEPGATLVLPPLGGTMPEPLTVHAPPPGAALAPLVGGSQTVPPTTLGGPLTFTGGSVPIQVGIQTDLRITGPIAAASPLVVRGGGLLRFSAPQAFTSGIDVEEGSVVAEADAAFGSGPMNLAQGTSLAAVGAIEVPNDISIAGTGPLGGAAIGGGWGEPELSGHITLRGETAFAAGDTLAITGAVTGTGPVRIVGSGRVALVGAGASSWTGGTFVDSGVLGLGRTGTLGAPGDVIARGDNRTAGSVELLADDQIADTARLEIQGSVGYFDALGHHDVLGPFASNSDTYFGITDGGVALSDLTTGDVAMAGTMNVVVDGQVGDILRVRGAVVLGAAWLELQVASPPPIGASVVLVDNDGDDPVFNTFVDLPEGATFTVDGINYAVTYRGGSGNDIAVRRVPPPTAPAPPPAPSPAPSPAPAPAPAPVPPRSGYWMLGSDGSIYAFGDAPYLGRPPAGGPPTVDIERVPTGNGYWVVDAGGRVSAFGTAGFYGSASALAAGETATSMSAIPDGTGYWIFTTKGRALPFGSAPFLGDMSGKALNGPVLDSVATPSGRGYYMVASDGGIFAFGDAVFRGSMGNTRLNAPVQSLVADPDGAGYWLVASDGGIFAFEAVFLGSMGGTRLNKPITAMVGFRSGYLMVAEDGGIFSFGDAAFRGSLGSSPPAWPATSVTPL